MYVLCYDVVRAHGGERKGGGASSFSLLDGECAGGCRKFDEVAGCYWLEMKEVKILNGFV